MLALIRAGVRSQRKLARLVGVAPSVVWKDVSRLMDDGLATKEPYLARTLRLTVEGERTAPYLQVARRRADGVFERVEVCGNGRK